MKNHQQTFLFLLLAAVSANCASDKGVSRQGGIPDYSGVYCLNVQNLEMTIVQTGDALTFTVQSGQLTDRTGTVAGNALHLAANAAGSEDFSSDLTFSGDGRNFSGPFEIIDAAGRTALQGTLQGEKGACPLYDIVVNGIPQFVGVDFTHLSKIEMISKFRAAFGHSFTDDFETCRSMKHYYTPYEIYRRNNEVEIYSPVTGVVISVLDDGHGASVGLNNKQIHIRPADRPAFTFVIFHVDLASTAVAAAKTVQAGELLGYARMLYEDGGRLPPVLISPCGSIPPPGRGWYPGSTPWRMSFLIPTFPGAHGPGRTSSSLRRGGMPTRWNAAERPLSPPGIWTTGHP